MWRTRRCCTIQSRREGAAFPIPRSRHHGIGFRPTELGHPVEDVTPDRDLSPLPLVVHCLQAASEHGLVSEEPVLHACLLSVARLLLPRSSPNLANSLKSRFTLRPWTSATPQSDEGDHNHDVLCTGRAGPTVDRPVVVGLVAVKRRMGTSIGSRRSGSRTSCSL